MERVKSASKIVAGAPKKLTLEDLKLVTGGSVHPDKVTIETKDGTKVVID